MRNDRNTKNTQHNEKIRKNEVVEYQLEDATKGHKADFFLSVKISKMSKQNSLRS